MSQSLESKYEYDVTDEWMMGCDSERLIGPNCMIKAAHIENVSPLWKKLQH